MIVVNTERRICLSLLAPFVILSIQFIFIYYFDLLESPSLGKIKLIAKSSVAIIMFSVFFSVLKRSCIMVFTSFCLFGSIFVFHYFVFEQNVEFLLLAGGEFFLVCLPLFIYSFSLRDWALFKEAMLKTSFILMIIGLTVLALVSKGVLFIGSYNMAFSYYLLIPLIVFFDGFFSSNKVSHLLFGLIVGLTILAIGARGPIFCGFIFIVLVYYRKGAMFFKKCSTVKRSNAFLSIAMLMLLISCMVLYKEVLGILSSLFLHLGIYSRSLRLFASDITYGSERGIIYARVWEALMNNPFLGIGLVGDRVVSGSYGAYSHNIFLEIISGFGLIGGSFLIIMVLFCIFWAFHKKRDDSTNMLMIWFCIGFIPLLISGSYVTSFTFWIFMGLVCNVLCSTMRIKCHHTGKSAACLARTEQEEYREQRYPINT